MELSENQKTRIAHYATDRFLRRFIESKVPEMPLTDFKLLVRSRISKGFLESIQTLEELKKA